MSALRLRRRISADPTSTALLLAGPSAVDLWPSARRDGELDGRVRMEIRLSDGTPTAVLVNAEPPQRTPFAFVCRFSAAGPELPNLDGVLSLRYAGPFQTEAVLEITLGPGGNDLVRRMLPGRAGVFLDNLAAAAEERATAA